MLEVVGVSVAARVSISGTLLPFPKLGQAFSLTLSTPHFISHNNHHNRCQVPLVILNNYT
jgi:hypothetical protein